MRGGRLQPRTQVCPWQAWSCPCCLQVFTALRPTCCIFRFHFPAGSAQASRPNKLRLMIPRTVSYFCKTLSLVWFVLACGHSQACHGICGCVQTMLQWKLKMIHVGSFVGMTGSKCFGIPTKLTQHLLLFILDTCQYSDKCAVVKPPLLGI